MASAGAVFLQTIRYACKKRGRASLENGGCRAHDFNLPLDDAASSGVLVEIAVR